MFNFFMDLETISKALQVSINRKNPLYFLETVSINYQDGKVLEEELDCYFERYKFHEKTISDKNIIMHLALLDAYNKILYRGMEIENEPSKKFVEQN